MVQALALLLLLAQPPSKATLKAIGCATRTCDIEAKPAGAAGTVLEVTLPEVKEVDGAECREPPREWWLVDEKRHQVQLLLTACNDGYGAAGIGDDTVELVGERFKHQRVGGAGMRWQTEREVRLRPLAVARETSTSYHAAAPDFSSTATWSRLDFAGKVSDTFGTCGPDGLRADEGTQVSVEAVLLPSVQLPAAFREGGWRTTALGACSASAPYTTFGKRGSAADASMKVVLGGARELYVEVRDDVFIERAASWVKADHLELWLSERSMSPESDCVSPLTKGGVQWGITLDGAVAVGFGSPPANPTVEVARADGVARFKLSLPPGDVGALTLVYSDTDDGVKQKRLLATSTLKYAQPATFGAVHLVRPEEAVCEVKGEGLVPVPTATFTASTPVLP